MKKIIVAVLCLMLVGCSSAAATNDIKNDGRFEKLSEDDFYGNNIIVIKDKLTGCQYALGDGMESLSLQVLYNKDGKPLCGGE